MIDIIFNTITNMLELITGGEMTNWMGREGGREGRREGGREGVLTYYLADGKA